MSPEPATEVVGGGEIAEVPAELVVAAVYGVGDIEQVLRRAGKPVLSLPKGAMCWA